MAFELPLLTDQKDVAIATKTPNGLNALRDGTAKYGGISTGAANVYDCVFTPVFTAYNEPMLLSFRAHQNNAGSATFKADALAALTMKKLEQGAQVNLVSGDIKINEVYFVIYQSTAGVAILLNPSQIVDGQLSSNVALLDGTTPFTVNQRINAGLGVNIAPPSTGDLAISGGMTAGTVFLERLEGFTGSKVFNFGNLGPLGFQTTDVTITGAAFGDFVLVSHSSSLELGVQVLGHITSANTVRLTCKNLHPTSSIDPASRTYYVKVIKKDF